MRLFRCLTLFVLSLAASLSCKGEEGAEPLRPVNSMFMVDIGSSHMTDTYLTPLRYKGISTAFNYERLQAMKFSPEIWNQQLNIGVDFNSASNPARNARMYSLNVSASWGMMRRWRLPMGIQAAIGGSSGVNLGAVYNRRNSNNPASAKADWTVNLTGYLIWNTRLAGKDVLFRWQSTLPLTGVFFSPEYDELYYEIYLGNRQGLAHWAYPGNFFRWNNLVSAECAFRNTVVRLGFRANVLSTKVNNIVSRLTTFSFSLGVGGNWLSVGAGRKLSDDAKIIFANY